MSKPTYVITVAAIVIAINLSPVGVSTASTLSETSVSHQKMILKKTVILLVPGMTCRVCPITVRKALEKVKGVNSVYVNFDAKTATVTYDPHQVSVSDLTDATEKSGYPSSL